MNVRQIPNVITVVRIALVPVLAWMLLDQRFVLALILAAFMGASDGLDGFLAKFYGWQTRLGSFLDPLADKIMLAATYLCLGWLELLPYWLVALVILRDLIILAGAATYHAITHKLEMQPSYISKLNTVVQILLALIVVLDQIVSLPESLLTVLIGVTVVTTAASGADYVVRWTNRVRCQGGSCT
ncbi:MAG: CDP-alcohol phosphatidyltransferase family protein [Gammaproteobacteria bacterium]|jgi:cardiolipin synthase|nr:CDP-alcohol phosphatidyltransferase family protein [Gammaproteobacteria bacterium]